MTGYVARRALSLVPTWLGISLFAFALSVLSPGDPAELILDRELVEPPTEEQLDAFRERNGLNDPFVVQYARWVGGAVTGDLGTSFRTGRPVLDELGSRLPNTLQITVPAFVTTMALALGVGVVAALRRNSLADHGSRVVALLGDSVPSFVLAYVLIIVFSVTLGLLPVAGRGGLDHLVLPVLTLALTTTATLMRLTRSSLLEVLGQDYIRTARAMGLHARTIVFRYALKNALIPVVTVAGLLFASFVTGTVIVETVFAWPGIGKFVVDSIFVRDSGTVFVVVNLGIDLLYVRLDPRIRIGSAGSGGG